MRFVAGVPAHVNHQHVLRFEGLLLATAVKPPTDEGLFVRRHVLLIDVQHQFLLRTEFAIAPAQRQ